MTSFVVTAEKARIFYSLEGPAGAPVVCLSHCFGSNHRYWDCHLSALTGFQILRYDHRGHGQSDCPKGPWSLEQMANDVIAILDKLDIAQIHFVGVSMGGMVGQTLALQHASRLMSVTLANSPSHYTDAQIDLWRERAQQVLDNGIASVQPALMQRWFTDEAARLRPPGYVYIEQTFSGFAPASFVAATSAICTINTLADLHRITCPALLFGSRDDPGVPVAVSEAMAKQIPDADLHWLTPSRHLASLEQVDTFNTTLRQFLKRVST